jgi:hypothetical protein
MHLSLFYVFKDYPSWQIMLPEEEIKPSPTDPKQPFEEKTPEYSGIKRT